MTAIQKVLVIFGIGIKKGVREVAVEMLKKRYRFVFTLVVIVILTGCIGQDNSLSVSNSGSLEGYVQDKDGNPLGGFVVTIIEGDTAFPEMAAITDEEGHFMLLDIPTGNFVIAINDRQGFQVGKEEVLIEGGMNQKLNIMVAARGVYTIHTLSAECGTSELAEKDRTVVEGSLIRHIVSIEAPNPCYEFSGNVTVEEEGDEIIVDLGLSPTSDYCIECVGLIVGEIKVHNLDMGKNYSLIVKTPEGVSETTVRIS